MNQIRTALITGASSGIGYELALIMAREGYDLVLVARRQDRLKELAERVKKEFERKVMIIAKDLAQASAAEEIFAKITSHKMAIDVLINNAGFGDFGLFAEISLTRAEEMIQVNIKTLTALTRLFLPDMIKRKQGHVLNVASLAGFMPGPFMAVYYATKAYVLSFSEALAEELSGTGVSVTALCPGPTASEFQAAASLDSSRLFFGKKLPTARVVAEYGYGAMRRGKVVVIPGIFNKILAFMVRLTPRSLVRKIVRGVNGKVA